MPSTRRFIAVALCMALLLGGCVSRSGDRVVQVAPPAPFALASGQPAALPDPVATLLTEADRHVSSAEQALALGQVDGAREAFERAIGVLLGAPDRLRGDARLREHLTRLVDRLNALDSTSVRPAEGEADAGVEPAALDVLLAASHLDTTLPEPATAETVAADLESTTHDIPIPVNSRILRYVELFQGRLREFLAEGLARGAQYLPMIQGVFRAEGLPLDLAYVPLVESAFKPAALSRAQARGMWQFMRGTALEHGLMTDWYIDERADPEKATRAAARYLKSLYDAFQDWHLALASYNGGPGRVQRAMMRSRRHDFWALSASSRYLPRETREYVPMVLAAMIIARNPVQYGFDVAPAAAPEVERVQVPPALDLRRVAEWAGVSLEDLQQLNPAYRRWTTPLREGAYELRVPAGTADRIREELAAALPHQTNALQWHTVKAGETLLSIAKKLRVSRADLAEANYLRPTARVTPGQRLVVPRMPSAALLARAAAAEAPDPAVDVLRDTLAVGAPERLVYRVRAGDTLYAIARRNGVTVDQLKAWNNLQSSRLQIGDRLVIAPQ